LATPLSLKSLRFVRVRSYVEGEKMLPTIKEIDPLEMQQLYYFIYHPSAVSQQCNPGVWIDWVFALNKTTSDICSSLLRGGVRGASLSRHRCRW